MGVINGLITVNCGNIAVFEGYYVELLGPSISGHRDNIVCTYFTDEGVKVELAYSGKNTMEVYRFKSASDLQHYWSRQYNVADLLKKNKYSNWVNYLMKAYGTFFTHQ